MFVGWIRKNTFLSDLEEFEKFKVIDKNLILNTVLENQSLCFGAYEDKKLVGFITAYSFEKHILINNFSYLDELDEDIQKRLVKILLNNIFEDEKSIMILSTPEEKSMFSSLGFLEHAKFKKALYSGGSVAFNFSNATAKSINNDGYMPIMKNLDSRCFNDERMEYITKNIFKSSSLMLSTQLGYQHSYALNKSIIKISPWVMEDGAFNEAEKLLRGVIYHRGLKKLVAFIPSDVKEITDLYESYNFNLTDSRYLMYKNTKPNLDLEMMYGF